MPIMNDAKQTYLAIDLGASSGRVLSAACDGRRLQLESLHRFTNGPVRAAEHLYWDVLRLWTDIQDGLRIAADRFGSQITSLGVDTWGVDFALLDRNDELLSNPYNYRDPQTRGMVEAAFERVPREEIFERTGLQFLEINTLFQLLAMQRAESPLLEVAHSLLMIPDYFHWLLTGEKANEFTDATTTQMLDPRSGQWATDLMDRFDLPTSMLGPIVPPGTTLGTVREGVRANCGLPAVPVVLPGTHDTASAVMAVPSAEPASDRPNWCYISSGTWSLMGVEVSHPVINDACREKNFTNEGGVGGTIRLLKNITGLWLVQECRRIWKQANRDYSWEALTRMAESATPLRSLIFPDESIFVAPDDMPAEIRQYCRQTGQPVPEQEGEIVRCILESLALRYRMVLHDLEALTGSHIKTVHIVGGGTSNQLLCQMAADACDRHVIAGPVEATALGNALVQAMAAGQVSDVPQARQLISDSFPLDHYRPTQTEAWDEAFSRFSQLATRP